MNAHNKKGAEPPKIKVAEAPEKKGDESRETGPAGENRVLEFSSDTTSLIRVHAPPVVGALGLIGLSGRAHQGEWNKDDSRP